MAGASVGAFRNRVVDFYVKSEGWRALGEYMRLFNPGLDLVAEKDNGLKEYLIVQCVEGDGVTAEDVAMFEKKASAFRRQLPPIAWWDERPPVTAVLAYTGALSPEAEARGRLSEVPVHFKRF